MFRYLMVLHRRSSPWGEGIKATETSFLVNWNCGPSPLPRQPDQESRDGSCCTLEPCGPDAVSLGPMVLSILACVL